MASAPPRTALELPAAPRLSWKTEPPPVLPPAGAAGLTVDDGIVVAHIAHDGSVRFDDRSSVRLGVVDLLRDPAGHLERWTADPRGHSERYGGQGIPIVEFDLTDLVMRAGGNDPYAARKRAFLDRTREARWAMSTRATTDALRASVALTPMRLDRVWRGPGTSAERRAILFALWDECADQGSDERLAAARAVRAAVVAFIRARLPTGSPDGFTAAELSDLNLRRTSRERFEP